jgi:hypothetical protein
MLEELVEMKSLFDDADTNKDGVVDMDEFAQFCASSQVREKLRKFDIPYDKPSNLFEMLDEDQGGTLTIFEFIDGISRLGAQPSPSDMRTAAMRVMNTGEHLNDLEAKMVEEMKRGSPPGSSAGSLSPSRATSRKRRKSTASSPKSSSPSMKFSSGYSSGHSAFPSLLVLPPTCRENTQENGTGDNIGGWSLTTDGVVEVDPVLDSSTYNDGSHKPQGPKTPDGPLSPHQARKEGSPQSTFSADLPAITTHRTPALHPVKVLGPVSAAKSNDIRPSGSQLGDQSVNVRRCFSTVRQNVNKRLGRLEQMSKDLARSQKNLEVELEDVLQRMSGAWLGGTSFK